MFTCLFPLVRITLPTYSIVPTRQESVNITCEVSGYAGFLPDDTITWNSSRFAGSLQSNMSSNKYAIEMTTTSQNSLIDPRGSVGPALVSTLTINQLSLEDEAYYTCNLGSSSSVTYLSIMDMSAVNFPDG